MWNMLTCISGHIHTGCRRERERERERDREGEREREGERNRERGG